MTQVATELADKLTSVPGVENVAASVGRAVAGDRIANVSSSDVWVTISDGADYDGAVRDIEEAADQVDGVRHDVMTYTTRAIRNVGALTRGENTVEGNDGLDAMTGSDRPLVVRALRAGPGGAAAAGGPGQG